MYVVHKRRDTPELALMRAVERDARRRRRLEWLRGLAFRLARW